MWELARGPKGIPESAVLLDYSLSVFAHLPEELPPRLEKQGRAGFREHFADYSLLWPLPPIYSCSSQPGSHRP